MPEYPYPPKKEKKPSSREELKELIIKELEELTREVEELRRRLFEKNSEPEREELEKKLEKIILVRSIIRNYEK